MEEGLDGSLFWRKKSGMEHVGECWADTSIWVKGFKAKDGDVWGWGANCHPTYLPFDYEVL